MHCRPRARSWVSTGRGQIDESRPAMSIHPVPGGPSRGRDRGADRRARAVIDARANERTDDGDDGDDWDGDVRARERERDDGDGGRERADADEKGDDEGDDEVFSRAERWCRVVDDDGAGDAGEGVDGGYVRAGDGRAGVPWG